MGNGIFRKNCSFFEHFTDDSNFRILAMAETEFNKQTMVRRNSKTEFRECFIEILRAFTVLFALFGFVLMRYTEINFQSIAFRAVMNPN